MKMQVCQVAEKTSMFIVVQLKVNHIDYKMTHAGKTDAMIKLSATDYLSMLND